MANEHSTSQLVDRLILIALINSGTSNQDGVASVADVVEGWLTDIADHVDRVPMPDVETVDDDGRLLQASFADALIARRRPHAEHRVLLSIHLDTVYGPDHPFQDVWRESENVLRGPGVADAKGGLIVLLEGLRRFESAIAASKPETCDVGWTVILTPDEEIGSLSSTPFLHKAAQEADIGLVYEPTLPDGTLIESRKGSGNFTIVVRGRSAHAGREIHRGRNAIAALCELFLAIGKLQRDDDRVTVNLGKFVGGGPVNVVPDLAVGRFNVRVDDPDLMNETVSSIESLIDQSDRKEGFAVSLHGGFTSPPKPLDEPTSRLLGRILDVGKSLGLDIQTASSGGVCDGNKLAAAGLPNLDTMGPRGGNIHSDKEYVLVDSLDERAQLTCDVMLDFAKHHGKYRSDAEQSPTDAG